MHFAQLDMTFTELLKEVAFESAHDYFCKALQDAQEESDEPLTAMDYMTANQVYTQFMVTLGNRVGAKPQDIAQKITAFNQMVTKLISEL